MKSDNHTEFKIGDYVRKTSGSQWDGYIVGFYSTELTPEGYAVESIFHPGSVQIYPAKALKLITRGPE
jgi:dihydrofolate reductase (trimethoprim resistance protein)